MTCDPIARPALTAAESRKVAASAPEHGSGRSRRTSGGSMACGVTGLIQELLAGCDDQPGGRGRWPSQGAARTVAHFIPGLKIAV